MSDVTLVFSDEHGPDTHVHCWRLTEIAVAVRAGDYLVCPFAGFVHVHSSRVEGELVYLVDCYEREHIYRFDTDLELARPYTSTKADAC